MRLTIWLVAAAGLPLAACAPVDRLSDQTPIPQLCGVQAARSLIGTHVGAVTFPHDANVRVVCTTCPVTKDLRPDRLNVRFDQSSGRIESVDCG